MAVRCHRRQFTSGIDLLAKFREHPSEQERIDMPERVGITSRISEDLASREPEVPRSR